MIPPAWTNVEINSSSRAKIQATGYDARGRKQYIYNPKYRLIQEHSKFDRLTRFAEKLGDLRGVVQGQLRRRKLDRDKVLAAMVRLLDVTHFRPGNESYARENKSYGLTTLRNKHIRIEGDTMVFDFQGKSNQRQHKSIVDARLSKIIQEINELPGYEIFKFVDENGHVHNVKSQDLNAYIRDFMGMEFSAKDFRTWAGTLIAAQILNEIGTVTNESAKQLKSNIRSAVDEVSKALGNTAAIAHKSYIDPRVIDNYIGGRVLDHYLHEIPTLKNKMPNLSVQELCLLCLLRQGSINIGKRL